MIESPRSEMEEWSRAGRQALLSGSIASALSTAALAALGKAEIDSAVAPTNATSHWLWGDRAYDAHKLSARHTAVGYATHHASAVMWATLFERWLNYSGRLSTAEIVKDAAAMSALAAFIDYQLTPRRLRPGFEVHLSRRSLAGVFLAFGAGLALGGVLNRRHERRLQEVMSLPEGTDRDQAAQVPH